MKFLDVTFDTPEQNLACDEALLNFCVREGEHEEILRFWESPKYFVVLGYTNRVKTEVYLEECERLGIPVLRRCTGGGTVLQGPGCLSYALVLRRPVEGPLRTITGANAHILTRHKRALAPLLGTEVEFAGTSDLAIAGRKFSGNSQRRKENWILFHGTFLLAFDIAHLGKLLPPPSKEPGYRRSRTHNDFLTNVTIPRSAVQGALQKVWNAEGVLENVPFHEIDHLVKTRYAQKDWIYRL
jgi:lipoate-protein ligase A